MTSRSIVRLIGWTALIISVWGGGVSGAEQPTLAEHQIKALYLFNFTKYVEWPAETTNTSFVIGVAEAPIVRNDLLEITQGKRLLGREIIVRNITAAGDVKGCHMLFIGDGNRQRLVELLRAAQGAAVLTVGEAGIFISLGGMINFTNLENRVRIEIGLDAVQRVHLGMSAKLLTVAGVVKGRPEALK